MTGGMSNECILSLTVHMTSSDVRGRERRYASSVSKAVSGGSFLFAVLLVSVQAVSRWCMGLCSDSGDLLTYVYTSMHALDVCSAPIAGPNPYFKSHSSLTSHSINTPCGPHFPA